MGAALIQSAVIMTGGWVRPRPPPGPDTRGARCAEKRRTGGAALYTAMAQSRNGVAASVHQVSGPYPK